MGMFGLVAQCVALALIWTGMALSYWICGNMLAGCTIARYEAVHYVLLAGTICVTIAVGLEFITYFLSFLRIVNFIKVATQFGGAILMLVGLIMYYVSDDREASGFLTTMGSAVFILAAVLGTLDLFSLGGEDD